MAREKKQKQRAHVKPSLSLSEIQELGGEKEDLDLLADIDDDSGSEIENFGKLAEFDENPIKRDEIKDLLTELEIYKYRPKAEADPADEEKGETESEVKGQTVGADPKEAPSTSGNEKASKKKKTKNKYKKDEEEQPSSSGAQKTAKTKSRVQHNEVSSTTEAGGQRNPIAGLRSHMTGYQPRNYLLVKTGGEWLDTEEVKAPKGQSMPDALTAQLEEFAAKLLRDEISVYTKQKENSKRSNVAWMKTVLTSGTLADKMGALMVIVQQAPLHNLAQLDTLIAMTKKKGKRECLQACDTVRELFLKELLPDNRKLMSFSQRSLLGLGQSVGWNKDTLDKRLLMWYFEAQLKEKYMEFLKAVETMSHDTVVATKQKAVNSMFHLLVNKPEQEKVLLSMLINKVGDPHYKLASTVSYLLMKVVESHPNMKGVVVREVEQLLFRPNISTRAQYYSVCFLTQLILSNEEQELAVKLITIYFSFFKGFVKKGEVDSKMMSALLSGVNRAFPYAKVKEEFLQEHLEPLYKIVHVVNFNTSIQALTLLYQVMDSGQSASERYYSALYRKLMDPTLKTSSKQALYLNLLFKSLKKDDSDRRIKAFIKRLLQVCSYQTPQFICGALVLMSEILRMKPGLMSLSQIQEDSDEEEHFVDEVDEEDDDKAKVTVNEGSKVTVNEGSKIAVNEEANVAVKEETDEQPDVEKDDKKTFKSSWVHRTNLNGKADITRYDPMARNPQYCHAEAECIWELESLTQHYHPSVSLFASQILRGEHIVYGGDPLQDFTLIRFLDRFVYKNPKKKELISDKVHTLSKRQYAPHGVKGMLVTTDQFQKLDERRVPVDDIYLHRFFSQKASRDKLKKKRDDADSDAESVDDDEFDDYLDKFEGNVDSAEIGDMDIDFASEFGKKKGKPGEDDSSSDEFDNDLSDEEVEFDDAEFEELRRQIAADVGDEGDADDDSDNEGMDQEDSDLEGDDDLDFDEENFALSDDAEDELQELAPKGKSLKRKKDFGKDMKKSKKGKTSDLFAASEEFGSLIDENVGSKIDTTGSDAVIVKDKADAKQIQWELKRDKSMKGDDWRAKKRGGGQRSKRFPQKQGAKTRGRKR